MDKILKPSSLESCHQQHTSHHTTRKILVRSVTLSKKSSAPFQPSVRAFELIKIHWKKISFQIFLFIVCILQLDHLLHTKFIQKRSNFDTQTIVAFFKNESKKV